MLRKSAGQDKSQLGRLAFMEGICKIDCLRLEDLNHLVDVAGIALGMVLVSEGITIANCSLVPSG